MHMSHSQLHLSTSIILHEDDQAKGGNDLVSGGAATQHDLNDEGGEGSMDMIVSL